MSHTSISWACVGLGALCIALSKPMGARAFETQRRLFGIRSSARWFQLGYLIAGLGLVLGGVLGLTGVIHFGQH